MIYQLLLIFFAWIVGITTGYAIAKIREILSIIESPLLEEKEADPTVVSPRPELANQVNNGAVIYPKSPQQVEFEEQEELKRLNPGKYS